MAKMLKEALKPLLREEEIKEIYSSFDIIGEIAIIKIPESLVEKKDLIGKAIMDNVKNVRSVFMQRSAVKGDYRIRDLECIAGINDTHTIYKEHNCRFLVDVSKVYFSPRLSTERDRIASLVNDNEVIVNMFAGICTFSIIIAKRHNCKIYSIDINPDAYALSIENVRMNKVDERVIPILGDAAEIIEKELKGKADRVLMPLPEKAKEYMDSAMLALKDHGFIHYFTHIHAENKRDAISECIKEVSAICRYDISNVRVVRAVGPRFYQLVADIIK